MPNGTPRGGVASDTSGAGTQSGGASSGSGAGGGATTAGGGANSAGGTSGAGGAAGSNANAGTGGESAPIACPTGPLTPGTSTRQLMHDGLQRSFIVHVPSSYDNTKPLPLVLSFHGLGSTPSTQESMTKLDAKADAEGFVVVYPEGSHQYSWNAGACCGDAQTNDVDDVGFARAIVTDMEGVACIDPKRVYATGFSNGGRMSYRLGCQAADVFAAIAPNAGIKSFPDLEHSPGCVPVRPIPLLDIVGTADERIQAQPGQIAEWVGLNGCTDAAPHETYRQGPHFCATYSQCRAGASVTFCQVSGVPHTWANVDGFSATDRVWELFKSVRLP